MPITKTVYIDLDPKIGLARKYQQGEVNRFEEMGLAFHQRVRQGFQIISGLKDYITLVDGNQSPEQIQLHTLSFISQYLQLHSSETILGQPSNLHQAKRWLNQSPLRATKIVATLSELSLSNTDEFLELWRQIGFSLRDGDLSPSDAEVVVKWFARSSIIHKMAGYALYNPEQFFETLSELSPEDKKDGFWRYPTNLLQSIQHEFNNQDRIVGWDKNSVSW